MALQALYQPLFASPRSTSWTHLSLSLPRVRIMAGDFPSNPENWEFLAAGRYVPGRRDPLLHRSQSFPAHSLSSHWNPEGFRPAETGFGYGVVAAGRSILNAGYGRYRAGPEHVYGFSPNNPVRVQTERFGLGLGRGPNQPFSVRTGGLGRERGGTGVFLPRVRHSDVMEKPRKSEDVKAGEQQKQSTNNAAVENQERLQLTSDLGLPQDWTY